MARGRLTPCLPPPRSILAVRNFESRLFGDGGVSKLNRLLKSPPFGALGPDLLLARLPTDTILFLPPLPPPPRQLTMPSDSPVQREASK